MKTITEYINIQAKQESINEASVLKSVLGDLFGAFKDGFKAIVGTMKEEGTMAKTALIVQATALKDIKDENERKQANDLINSYSGKNSDEIIAINIEYLEKHNNPKSKFNTSLIYLTYKMCEKSKNEETKKKTEQLKELLEKQDPSNKKEVLDEIKEVEKKNPSETTQEKTPEKTPEKTQETTQETTQEKTEEKPEDTEAKEKIEQEIEDIKDKSLDNLLDIDNKELVNAIWYALDMNSEEFDKLTNDDIAGIASMLIGAKMLNDNEKLSEICDKFGIDKENTGLQKALEKFNKKEE